MLAQFKEKCKVWVLLRRKDVECVTIVSLICLCVADFCIHVRWLTQSLNTMDVSSPQGAAEASTPPVTPPEAVPSSQAPQPSPSPPLPSVQDFASELPPPDSNAWQSASSSPPPPVQDDFAMRLPPPDSKAWETIRVPAPPRRPVKQPQKTRTGTRHAAF